MLDKAKRLIPGLILIFLLFLLLLPFPSLAREKVTDWYIKNFESEIVVNQDSSLLITEKITADCGEAVGKHGIFRILPTQVKKTATEAIKTPIELISITDFNDRPLKYKVIKNRRDQTLTWKIGDPDVTVQGENYYKLKYQVKNAIRFDNPNFDEFYWNLNGNFWELEIDRFVAKIIFPSGVTQNNTRVEYYTGQFGSKDKSLTNYGWLDSNTLAVYSTGTLQPLEGITFSVTFPKNIFTPYQLTSLEKYGPFLYLLIPLLVLIVSFLLWSKFGIDPKISPTVAPEFEIPENLTPLEMGVLISDGRLKPAYISAAIVNLAVRGIIQIEKIGKRSWLRREDYQLKLLKKDPKNITTSEKLLIEKLFSGQNEITLSSLRNKFYKEIRNISSEITKKLTEQNMIKPRSRTSQIIFIVLAAIFVFLTFFTLALGLASLCPISLALSAVILFIFSFLMRQRTREGALLLQRIKGFRLYMETAERYRQRFYEKANIFEKYLPYAMVFGITSLWIEKMKTIYGEDYYATYRPAWYGAARAGAFDAQSFNSAINSLSSNMASTLASSPSSSGAGGGGFSGGGGGGGGGGGW